MSVENDIEKLLKSKRVFSPTTGKYFCDGSGVDLISERFVTIHKVEQVGSYYSIFHGRNEEKVISFVGCKYFKSGVCLHPRRMSENCDHTTFDNMLPLLEAQETFSKFNK